MSTQSNLNLSSKSSGPVECLGQTFPSDDARREHYLKLLAEKLKDPEFRKIEGFPIGEDEDILALSDPPYYTACPNPWIGDFIQHYGRPYDPKEQYHREPFAADVSEGKNHPIYQTHSYHTKVPHRAIMRYILHYTEPGDVVFDGFCGTGMMGVAAQLSGDPKEIAALGYQVKADGTILNQSGRSFSKIGIRKSILSDLSPAASFIASSYNNRDEGNSFTARSTTALQNAEADCGWMYSTLVDATEEDILAAVECLEKCSNRDDCKNLLSNNKSLRNAINKPNSKVKIARINYTTWSEVFSCPECGEELVFWDAAVSKSDWQVNDVFECTACRAAMTKARLERVWKTTFDKIANAQQILVKQVPVLISAVNNKQKFYRKPDRFDLELIKAIERTAELNEIPVIPLPHGDKMGDPKGVGIQFFHQFYFYRSLAFLDSYAQQLGKSRFFSNITSSAIVLSKMYRFRSQGGSLGAGGGPMNGTLYVPSLIKEIPAPKILAEHVTKAARLRSYSSVKGLNFIQTASLTQSPTIPDSCVDYLFIDPPFGSNIMYSELNFIWESWLKVRTNIGPEAIENKSQKKEINSYRKLMHECFREAYRILKPGRWMTVEFSNTKAEIWNSIQSSLQEAGFIVANVSALDKKQLGFNAVNNPTSVKQDLVISAYKPNGGLEERFSKSSRTIDGVWDFIRTHLSNLPVVKPKGGELEFIVERDPRILYDRMVAFYICHGVPVPLNSAEFRVSLSEKFIHREGMFFLPDQVAEWDKKRAQMHGVGQMSIFVEDEKSAIDWLRIFLRSRPSVAADITTEFMQQLGASWKKFETRPELSLLLEQNFLKYDGKGEVPSQIHSYLSTQNKDLRNLPKDDARLQSRAKDRWYVPDPAKAVDVEAVRNKRLLQEFWDLCTDAGIGRPRPGDPNQPSLPMSTPTTAKKTGRKKLKEVRTEAVRLGFKECFAAKDYATILAIAGHLPANVIEEDEQLQMMHDMAEMRSQG